MIDRLRCTTATATSWRVTPDIEWASIPAAVAGWPSDRAEPLSQCSTLTLREKNELGRTRPFSVRTSGPRVCSTLPPFSSLSLAFAKPDAKLVHITSCVFSLFHTYCRSILALLQSYVPFARLCINRETVLECILGRYCLALPYIRVESAS